MQKALPKQSNTFFRMQLESTKKMRPYQNTKACIMKQAASIQKISASSNSRNDKHAKRFYVAGVIRVWFIANEQGRL